MPRSSRAESEATARRVRLAAGELFAEHGYTAIGLEQVAAAAGVTRGAVYHHFGDKRSLFLAVFADAQAIIASEVASAAPGDGWPALIDGSLAFVRAAVHPRVRRIVLVDAPSILGWEQWRHVDAQNAAALLSEGLSALDDLAIDPQAAGALLNGAMNEAALWIASGGDATLIEPGLVRLINSLRAPSAR